MPIEDKLWIPPLSPQDQKRLDRLQKNGRKVLPKWMGFAGKTFWDWLNLLAVLAIPLVVLGATLLFSIQQANLAQQQHENDQMIANQQREADKRGALDQQQATILQTYIDNIQDLLLNYNLQKSYPTDKVAILARARTLAALQGLDPHRKGVLLNFLYEAHLIGYHDRETGNSLYWIIDLTNADLTNADLTNADLKGAHLNSADLNGAHLWQADLMNADLINADLVSADLGSAYLGGAHLNGAHLARAIMNGTDLGAAVLISADLNGADLTSADLSYADLTKAHLHHTLMSGADLSDANLSDADLSGALVAPDQLAQAKSLKGATMPNGSKHP